MLRTSIIAGFMLVAGPCIAATDLGVEWSQVSGALFLAASRAGVTPPVGAMRCIGDYPNSCRWDAGDGVSVLANDDGSGHLRQIEAGWNNAKPESNARSPTAFRTLCATIAALAVPKWGKVQVAATVGRILVVRPSRKDSVDQDQALPGVRLYGSRNTPSAGMRDRPDEAFLQCGAVAE